MDGSSKEFINILENKVLNNQLKKRKYLKILNKMN